jgi:predicted nucleic acid-binding Zn ribbon protein
VHRLLSAAPFILKGEGWYVTDYPSESRKKALSAEKSSTTAPSDKSEKSEKSDKPDKPAAAPAKSDGAGTSGASSGASTPKPSD